MKKILILISFSFYLNLSYSQEVIQLNSIWSFFKGDTMPSADMSQWSQTTFNDISWTQGNAPFRYGDGTGGTNLTDMRYKYTCVFLRSSFEVTLEDTLIDKVSFSFDYDDGFRLWINGKVVIEKNAPASIAYNTVSTALRESGTIETNILNASLVGLKKGNNLIAVQVFNNSLESSDLYFDLKASIIRKVPDLPAAPEPIFSKQGGYYNTPFNLILSSANTGDTILYTLDCSEPANSTTAIMGKSPLTFFIDSTKSASRPNTPGVVVRAIVKKYGFGNKHSESRTYIFENKIKAQTYPGSTWPAVNDSDQSKQYFDYDIDPRIVNDSKYSTSFLANFKSIPTVSVVTENKNLFEPGYGIYVSAELHGDEWERDASVEYIDTIGNTKFAVGAGLRIRGGYSRNLWNPKHAFRIFLKDEYGKSKLKYPFWGTDGAQEFEKFDLRCAQNYSWSFYNNAMMTYAQDEYARDIQGLMVQPFTRSQYVHLFLNGMYWGLYEIQERPEANFAATYLGGNKDNYDVVKVATELGHTIEATDGTLAKWNQLYNMSNTGFESNTNYFKVQGLNAQGEVDTTLECLVNIDNLIDYMLNIFYTGNFDAPVSEFGNNSMPNNFYAIKNRNEKREGFIFIVHDAEHTLNYVKGSEEDKNDGVNENRVSLENDGMTTVSINTFNPQWLHYKLTANAEYRQRFADRAYKYLYNNGLFTPSTTEKVFRNRAKQIEQAIICESARWGDSNGNSLRTKDTWTTAVNNTVNQFIKLRTPIVINQLKSANLLFTLEAPKILLDAKELAVQQYKLTSLIKIQLSNTNASGNIYYTLDGSDPRLPGGKINPLAVKYTVNDDMTIQYALRLKARVLDGTNWSAVHEILFTSKENLDKIRITEIQYHPTNYGSINSKDIEFLELKNTGTSGIDLGGCKIDSAVNYTFPEGTIINPNGFVIIAADANGFEYVFKRKPTGEFTGNLANEGERIILTDSNGNILIDMKYDGSYPWPNQANGSGKSLVANEIKPNINPNLKEYWRASRLVYGSPFADDSLYISTNTSNTFAISNNIEVYPNPVSKQLFISYQNEEISGFEITELSGRRIYAAKIEDQRSAIIELNIEKLNLTNGIYIIKIDTRNGIYPRKVVVQHY